MKVYMQGHVFYTDGTVKSVKTPIPEDREPEDYIDEVQETWNSLKDVYKIQGFVIGTVRLNDADN